MKFPVHTLDECDDRPSFDDAAGASGTLVGGLTPGGSIHARAGSTGDGPCVTPAAARRILDAFEAGRGHGVLSKGAFYGPAAA